MKYKGIDVSVYQGNVDFNAVKNSGIDFVIIRSGYGNVSAYPNQVDPQFENNVRKAKQAGVNFGVYHYSYFTTVEAAKAEARGFVGLLDKVSPIPYIVALDIEEECQKNLSTSQLEACTKAFIDIVESAGYFCALYSYESFLTKYSADFRKRYAIWCANINNEPSIGYGIWQNSFVGRVNGISGDVDLDCTNIDYAKIIKDAGLNGYPKTDNSNSKETKNVTPFDKFFAERLGKGIDVDGNGVYCFDLANDYSVNLVGGKNFIGDGAYEIYTNFANQPGKELYERIPNTPEFVPIKGDIMVWGQGLGKWGHVAICNGKGDTTWFESYEQNWTGNNDPVALIKHNYNNVLGVLRPKDQSKVLGKKTEVDKKTEVKETKVNEKAKVRKNGDVNGDGRIDAADVAALVAHVKGIKKLDD